MSNMPIADYTTYVNEVAAPFQNIPITKAAFGSPTAGRWSTLWLTAQDVGVAVTGASVPSRTLTGAFGQFNSSGGVMRMAKADLSCSQPGVFLVCDRLSHQGGLSAFLTGGGVATGSAPVQTKNLPTASLTRYTGGVGVFIGLEISSAIGASIAGVTATYTNQAGLTGRATSVTRFGSTGFSEANKVVILPLQQGDTGVQSVASVTVLTGTGTAGVFGVVLFKPLFYMPVLYVGHNIVFDSIQNCIGAMPQTLQDACLFGMFMPNAGTAPIIDTNIAFIEE